jgi:hypothetical protein
MHVQENKEKKNMKCINNTKTVTKLLVAPPASHGYFLKSNHELSNSNSP